MATYYVRSAGGSDGNSGLSFALGWATIQYAADNASTAGDIVLVCADGNHLPTATVLFDTNTGSRTNPITFRGASAVGVDDGTVAIVSGTSLPATSDLFNYNLAGINLTVENMRLTEATRYNITYGFALNSVSSLVHKNVRIDNAGADGIYDYENSAGVLKTWINCEIDSNTDKGCESSGSGRGGHKLFNCSIHDNGGVGWEDATTDPKSIYENNLFYKNGGDGLEFSGLVNGPAVSGNVFFGNSGNGMSVLNTEHDIVCFNNIFRSNGGYGINTNTGAIGQFAYADYNCFNNNTSGAIDINSNVAPGDNNITTDPTFTNETAGSEDFTLQSGSPCLDVGLGYNG